MQREDSRASLTSPNEMLQHVKQANYQSHIWKHVLNTNFEIQFPNWHVLRDKDRKLDVVWIKHKPDLSIYFKLSNLLYHQDVNHLFIEAAFK